MFGWTVFACVPTITSRLQSWEDEDECWMLRMKHRHHRVLFTSRSCQTHLCSFKLFRFRRLLLERPLGRVQDSLTKSKKDNKHATRALIKQPFNWCVRWKAFVWLTHSSHMIDCINCMYYGLYLLCSLCSYLITFQGVTSLWAKWIPNLSRSYCISVTIWQYSSYNTMKI